MQPDARKLLFDIAQAGELIVVFAAGKDFSDYEGEPMLRPAIERQIEIIGEALAQLSRLDQSTANRVREHRE